MLDVGFTELLVIGAVALLVIGPEKLPRLARTIGALMGRAQRYVNDVKADINREIELDELKKIKTSITDAALGIESSMRETVAGFEAQATELNTLASGGASTSPDGQPGQPAAASGASTAPVVDGRIAAEPAPLVAPDGAQASLPLDAPQAPQVPQVPQVPDSAGKTGAAGA